MRDGTARGPKKLHSKTTDRLFGRVPGMLAGKPWECSGFRVCKAKIQKALSASTLWVVL